MHLTRILLAATLLASSSSSTASADPSVSSSSPLRPRQPKPRSYDSHTYYALELAKSLPESAAQAVAHTLGVELVEPLGELAGHWIVRREGGVSEELSLGITERSAVTTSSIRSDPVMARWDEMRAQSKRSLTHTRGQLRSLTPLVPRQRAKRVVPARGTAPLRSRTRSMKRGWAKGSGDDDLGLERRDDTELLYAQNDLGLVDPMLNQQWHLINTDNPDIELNVTGLWGQKITGTGVKVVIVDDGLDMESDDLKANFYPEGSWDFNDHTELPIPRLSDDQHGTRCAGEIAAVPNDVCGVGVAYNSKIAGVRILSAPISDADEAAALNYAYQLNEIYSCSWGPPDDGKSMEAPDGIILKAMVNGVQNGRGGKGSLFVFAAGNGGSMEDQCNFDGYTNSIFSITVGAVDHKGLHPFYSEMCAAMMVVAPSSGSGDSIHTTDVGKDKCAHNHGGTSAAAPLAAGVYALALEVRPELTWRDFQHLSINHAVFFNPEDPDWEKTAAGRMFSYKYGYGRIDAGLFVEAARTWKLVKPQAWFDSPAVYLPTYPEPAANPTTETKRQETIDIGEGEGEGEDPGDIFDNDDPINEPEPEPEIVGTQITEDGITSTYEVTQEMLADSNFERLEHVTVRVWIEHQRRGDVEVELTSPNGITSVLARSRRFDEDTSGYPGWKFMSLKHWDEKPVGTWTITVHDKGHPDKTGRFIAWSLQLWGEVIDAKLAKIWAPAEYGEPDEEETGSDPTATSAVSQKPKPTEHLPGDHGDASGEADQPGLASPTPGPSSTSAAGDDEDVAEPTGSDTPSDAEADEGWFDGIEDLARDSRWLAGAGLIVVLFGVAGGLFIWIRIRRRRQRQSLFGLANSGAGAAASGGRGAYAPVSEDVPMGLLERSRRRLGLGQGGNEDENKDLYDAFGDGPSDDEDDDLDGGGIEGSALRYHDDFLDDDDHDHDHGAAARSTTGAAASGSPPAYRDDDAERASAGTPPVGTQSNASSSSWHDAAADAADAR